MWWTAGGVSMMLLAACSQGGQVPRSEETMVDCALSGATAFAQDCVIERAGTAALPTLIVRHPDGGFRRFEVLDDGGLSAADGADTAIVSRANGKVEVALGSDRYRFPADAIRHDRR